MCEVHRILSRIPLKPWTFERDTNFTFGPVSNAKDEIVLTEKGWTLFGFNFKNRTAVFLEIGVDEDVSTAPFAYSAQYDHATRVATMPFDAFLELAQIIDAAPRLVHLFNIGHCGSTLLHHVFNASGEAWCVSEPLFTFDLAMNRSEVPPRLLRDLAGAALRFLTLFPGIDLSKSIVLKHFSQATTVLDVWYDAAPNVRCLFLYRDAESWCNSLYGFRQRLGFGTVLKKELSHFFWRMMSGATPESFLKDLIDLEGDDQTHEELSAIAWALHCQQYHQALAAHVPLKPFRFNELNQHRLSTVQAIFAACGLNEEHVQSSMEAFDHDSHEGAATAHDKPVVNFSQENYERIRRLLANPRLAISADVILPSG